MSGDDLIGFLGWVLLLPVVLGAIIGLIFFVGFGAVAAFAAFAALNHGLTLLVGKTVTVIKARIAARSAGEAPQP